MLLPEGKRPIYGLVPLSKRIQEALKSWRLSHKNALARGAELGSRPQEVTRRAI
jgi:hypothetical protein